MRILIVHNEYSKRGGEESVVAFQKAMLEKRGHRVVVYSRSYGEMNSFLLGRFGGMFSSIYNNRSIREVKRLCEEEKFDVAILHNLFPIISAAIIPLLKREGVRVLQVVHNYRLFCPIGILYRRGNICQDCLKKGREWHCLKNRCAGGFASSFSFAFKFWLIRHLNHYKGVDEFLCLNSKQQELITKYLNAQGKTPLLPNALSTSQRETPIAKLRGYVSFVGRLTEEKGFDDFLKLASLMPDYRFKAVGGLRLTEKEREKMPKNVEFCGFIGGGELREHYAGAKAVVVLSKWYESFGLVIIEAMNEGTPVVVYDTVAANGIVDEGINGFVVPKGDLLSVKERIERLFSDDSLFETLSQNAKEKVRKEYLEDRYYERLMQIAQ